MIYLKTSTSRRDIEHSLGLIQAKLILALLKKSTGSTKGFSPEPKIELRISLHIPLEGCTEEVMLSREPIHNLVIRESFLHQFPELPEKLLEGH